MNTYTHFLLKLIGLLTISNSNLVYCQARNRMGVDCKYTGCMAPPPATEGKAARNESCLEYQIPCKEPENTFDYFKCCNNEQTTRNGNKAQVSKPSSSVNNTKIIDGLPAEPGQFPYQVAIYYETVDGTFFICGGTIYNEQYVITAAQCVLHDEQIVPRDIVRVVAGGQILYETDAGEQVSKINGLYMLRHYNGGILVPNGIALLSLKTPLEFTETVQPIKLAPRDYMPTGTATVSGWTPNIFDTSILSFTNVQIISEETCEEVYENYHTQSMICATTETGVLSLEDVGGPLTCTDSEDPEGRYLCGIVSSGLRCLLPDLKCSETGFYIKLSYVISFIEEVVNQVYET